MVTARLKGVFKVTAKGRTYWYAWRGGPRLTGEPGSPEFVASYAAAHEATRAVDASRVKGLVSRYKGSPDYRELAPSTQRQWTPWLDRITDQFGELRIRQFDRPQIRLDIRRWRDKWRGTPRTADYGLQVLSRVLAFAVAEGMIALNPCNGVPRLYRANRADIVWTDADFEKLEKAASPELMHAARLAALTGLRQGDLLTLSWSQVGDNAIELRTRKSQTRTRPTAPRTVVIPLYRELRELLAEIPKRSTRVLTNTEAQPWKSGFSASWNKAMKRCGLADRDLHFHDLRGTAATRFYRARFSNREIAEIMGWSEGRVERLIDRYVKRDELLRDRVRRIEKAERGTKNAKPTAKR